MLGERHGDRDPNALPRRLIISHSAQDHAPILRGMRLKSVEGTAVAVFDDSSGHVRNSTRPPTR
jgi:hypothetical protein